jgi:NAD+ kinase
MHNPTSIPRRIALFVHPEIFADQKMVVDEMHAFLLAQKLEVVTPNSADNLDFRKQIRAGDFDMVIAMGGDGTMLRAGHLCAPSNVPVLGINLGHFGFLMELKFGQWRSVLPRLLSGDFQLEDRMMLGVALWRGNSLLESWQALNEVVITRGHYVRPIRLGASVDGFQLSNFIADGLIVATATGSTAYALAAGGPILPPELHNIVVMAVAPHLSVDRAVVLAGDSCVTITVDTDHEAVLSVDGQNPVPVLNGDQVRAQKGENVVSFVRFQDPGYFYRNLTSYMQQNPLTNHDL